MAKKGVTIRLNTELRDWLQSRADKDDRNLSNYICRVLEQHKRVASLSHCGNSFEESVYPTLNPDNVR